MVIVHLRLHWTVSTLMMHLEEGVGRVYPEGWGRQPSNATPLHIICGVCDVM